MDAEIELHTGLKCPIYPSNFMLLITASLPLSTKTRQAVTLVLKPRAVSTIKAAVSPLIIPTDGHRQPGRPNKTIYTLYDGMIIIQVTALLVFIYFFNRYNHINVPSGITSRKGYSRNPVDVPRHFWHPFSEIVRNNDVRLH